jgi:RimJ/RimL family protein N-acetyltransferase
VKNVTRNKLRLRPYKSEDAKVITTWIHSELDQKKWSADRYDHYPITPEDMNEQYRPVINSDDFLPMTALDGDKIVGHLILRYPGEDRDTIRFGFVIVDDTLRGKGYGKEMLQLAIKYVFEILQAKKITLGVFENNPEAYRCYKAVGFEETDKTLYFECMGEQWKCIEMEMGRN